MSGSLESLIGFLGLVAGYVLVAAIFVFLAWKLTENSNRLLRSLFVGSAWAVVAAPSFIGTEGFALPAPALAAWISVYTIGNMKVAETVSLYSIMIFSVINFLACYFLFFNDDKHRQSS